MPARNRFRHQSYNSAAPTSPPTGRVEVWPAPTPAPVGSVEFQQQLARAGKIYRHAGVRYLYLLHGTFAGNDAFGLFGEIARFFPDVGQSLRSMGKSTFDRLIGEAGNYTAEYAQTLEAGLNAAVSSRTDCQVRPIDAQKQPPTGLEAHPTRWAIEVRRFHWSGENHHIARADTAIRLIDDLAALDLKAGERILLWCHSHAGNVLALLTNLLAAAAEERRQFYRACRTYYRWPKFRRIDLERWPRVREILSKGEHAILQPPLDVATFGTPVRYGWDTTTCGRLMHFVHHQPTDGQREDLAPFPPSRDALLHGHADFIQQLGIAGTDFPPGPLVWRSWLADRRLARFLAPDLPRRGVLARLRMSRRAHADGTNLLIDYGPQAGTIAHHLLGHAVYTRTAWMAFHAEQIARVFYTDDDATREGDCHD